MKLEQKKMEFEALSLLLNEERKSGKKVVLCLGVFDLLHPGHIRHLHEAKKFGDILVVAVTANKYVNKGPDRPVFTEELRMESIGAIECVDYVCINNHSAGTEVIRQIKPDFYVKGVEYKEQDQDLTGKIELEQKEVEKHQGKLVYTEDVVFSSSKLLNSYFSDSSKEFKLYVKNFKSNYSIDQVIECVDDLKNLNVLVIGDAIIDQYVYVDPLGVSGKGTHLVARCKDQDTFLGGSFAVANHVAGFTSNVTLLTAVGSETNTSDYLGLQKDVKKEFLYLEETQTLIKRRYVQRDGRNLTKLFETYSSNDNYPNEFQEEQVEAYLNEYGSTFDLVIVCDFGNGFLSPKLNAAISKVPSFLSINTQINSGNRGYHVVTKYDRADYISLNEPELRLTTHDLHSDLSALIPVVAGSMNCRHISVTQGVRGVVLYDQGQAFSQVPALTQKVVDRVGAGDSYLALSSLVFAKGYDSKMAGFLGSAAAALDVQIIGNSKCIEKIPFLKYITTLLK